MLIKKVQPPSYLFYHHNFCFSLNASDFSALLPVPYESEQGDSYVFEDLFTLALFNDAVSTEEIKQRRMAWEHGHEWIAG
jgi:hypothetical protein